jgi:hypothetical protein
VLIGGRGNNFVQNDPAAIIEELCFMATVKRPRMKKSTETKEPAGPQPVSSMTSVKTRSMDMQDAIRKRAYELYTERGGDNGDDVQDWVRAEKEIVERFRRTV